MQFKNKTHILDELTLSRDELLKVAAEMSVKDKVYLKKTDHAHLQLHEEHRMIENAFLAARQNKHLGKELPALSEWFYDNRTFFIEQIKLLDLANRPCILPHIANGRYAQWPRCLALASVLLGHSALDISIASITEFLDTYQKEAELDSGEIWVFADMLKIGLLRAAAQLGHQSTDCIRMWNRAEKFCKKAEKNMLVSDTLLDEYRADITNPIFLEHVSNLLRDSPHISSVRKSLNKKLLLKGQSIDKLIKMAHTEQAFGILRISGAISSLRLLSKVCFEQIFENISAVHRYLKEDTEYEKMDFESRDYYRRAISSIASALKLPEVVVARTAMKMAAKEQIHVGFFIAGYRIKELYTQLGGMPLRVASKRFFKKHMMFFYVGGAAASAAISALLLSLVLFYMFPAIVGILGFVVSLIPIYTVSIAVSNRLFALFCRPAFIPKMALYSGIHKDCATMVVIPALVTSDLDGMDILSKMEVYYAANQQENLFFTLLSDFKDDKNEIAVQDEAMIEGLEKQVACLNTQYGRHVFFYAQRRRIYNKENAKYGGYERKRGALLDFCELLSGDLSAFVHVTKELPTKIKYVITLDADTQLTRDAAVKMIGAMEHPLNRPLLDQEKGIVTKGYAVMQPRIGVDVASAAKSRFSLIFSGKGGLDVYASATSDIYQDGFGTGIYTGKGIFHLELYKRILRDAFPDNSILSHDLLEGSYLRCALLSDVMLMDGCPAQYTSWATRQHRWTRGDWQLLPWLKSTIRTKSGTRKNPLSALQRYQIIDNLRRSLTVPFCFFVILLSQTAFYQNAFFWFISGLLPLFIDGVLDFLSRCSLLLRKTGKGATLRDIWHETKSIFEQSFYKFAFLPYETFLMLDAAVKSMIRMGVTRRNLLEWQTAAEGEKNSRSGISYYWSKMAAAPLLASILYALSIVFTRSFSVVAFGIFSLWFFAPSIAQAISRPRRSKIHRLNASQNAYLMDIALQTWLFFEHFAKEDEYYWMPDNYQHSPGKGSAKRTSPTNVALSMAAFAAAYYMGFCSASETLKRLEKCTAGIEKAEKWHGHLYNWYDITNLQPLEPLYVSSVDSGNLACYLVLMDAVLADMLRQSFASFIHHGVAAAARAAGQKIPLHHDADIFSILHALELFDNADGLLQNSRLQSLEWFQTYAPWARVLWHFPASKAHIYAQMTQHMRQILRFISPIGYIKAFHNLLEILSEIYQKAKKDHDAEALCFTAEMEKALGEGYVAVRRLCRRIEKLRKRMNTVFTAMDFSKLYDDEKGLFSIGYEPRRNALSDSHYDLLASEARAASFIAIAKGDIPEKHWFRLSRPLTVAGQGRALLSWGGTMFEYLMPLILLKSYDNTLLGETYKSVVDMHVSYGEQRHIPWGVSESGYYAFDLHLNYQYKAFGVPGLGLKSGLVRESVVAPYATCLALHVNPRLAIANMMRLKKLGAAGKYGFYEAIDYTFSRMHVGKQKHIIKSYMAHHQGMILASILNCVQNGRFQELFHSVTCIKATEMLLKEKVPPRSIVLNVSDKQETTAVLAEEIRAVRTYHTLSHYPQAHFLSNGNYTVMLTQMGTGYSMCRGYLINRWGNDVLRRSPGIHVFIKNLESGAVWSAAFLPTCLRADEERVQFEPHKATFFRKIGGIETTLTVCVSPECDMEIRDLEIKNCGNHEVKLALICVLEPVLSKERDYLAHPAFTELFIDTQPDIESKTIYIYRRNRPVFAAMKACFDGKAEILTDRAHIFGRGTVFGTPQFLRAKQSEQDISKAAGLQAVKIVPPAETVSAAFIIALSDSQKQLKDCIGTISAKEDIKRTVNLAWTHAQVEMRYLKLKSMEANLFQQIASRTVIRIPSSCLSFGTPQGKDTLYQYGLSGENPLVCLFVDGHESVDIEAVKMLTKAHEFLSLKQIPAELVFVYDDSGAYTDMMRDLINEAAQTAAGRAHGRIAVVPRRNQDDAATAAAASCLVLFSRISIAEQLKIPHLLRPYHVFEREVPYRRYKVPRRLKSYDNGTGGFLRGGKEYCIEVTDCPPLPWSNLLAGKSLGCIISAGGGGYTWADNARMLRLTPFRNDALTDVPGEGVIIRNDRTGYAFSVAPDMYADGRYRVIHGLGYTSFERFGSIHTYMTYFTDKELPVKSGILSITNNSAKDEVFSVYYYAEPVLGAQVVSGISARKTNSRIEAFSPFAPITGNMFISIPGQSVRCTASAHEFFGVPGHNILPEALKTAQLSDDDGCGASLLGLQTQLKIAAGEERKLNLLMGFAEKELIESTESKMDSAQAAEEALRMTKDFWRDLTGRLRISTGNKSFDTIVNGWLLYQTYASRLLGRTGYYQSGGAYGFRDQLQDVMALLYTDPNTAYNHILKCASRQFIEGDVLHWWHEPAWGVRTLITDDKLFLPYVACEYERVTGDMSIFDKQVPYLKSRPIPKGKVDIYERFEESDYTESLFLHCKRAIDSALNLGQHELPLMGTGDWNDGMDKVGEEGKGESVWLAFFLAVIMQSFAAVCRIRGETELAESYDKKRIEIKSNIEKNAWDGEWYLRAYFDDGTPVGSSMSPECSIDLVSQAWSVLSGAVRARRAFFAAYDHLVMREHGVIRLLMPPFDKWEKDPGYIKAYLPGVRENGGQYTHAAAWFVIAAAKLKLKEDAIDLFQMINPINHTRTPAGVAKYKGEPYVIAADVYDAQGHTGRAGWTWYTGAAGWMYQAAIKHIIGMHIERGILTINPCVPDNFGRYTIEYDNDGATYIINVDITPGYQGQAWLQMEGCSAVRELKLDKRSGVHRIFACWKT